MEVRKKLLALGVALSLFALPLVGCAQPAAENAEETNVEQQAATPAEVEQDNTPIVVPPKVYEAESTVTVKPAGTEKKSE
jgi:hypothetical protein